MLLPMKRVKIKLPYGSRKPGVCIKVVYRAVKCFECGMVHWLISGNWGAVDVDVDDDGVIRRKWLVVGLSKSIEGWMRGLKRLFP